MGIHSLLEKLRDIEQKKHVRAYAGQKVAVDGYCWLHKAVYTCKKDLAVGNGMDKLISYCIKRINLMRECNVTPVMVFDGGKLQMKKSVEDGRKKNRDKCREMAEELLRQGDEESAMKKYGESIDITPQIAHTLIKVLQALGVEYYVAPYEADAQLAYLWFKKIVDVVATEDSDLLAFGVQRVFFKMDPDGYGIEVDLGNLRKIKKPNFTEFTQEMLLITCIFSGCDYLDSIKGIGFVRAQKLVEQAGEDDTYHEVMKVLKEEGKVSIPDSYEQEFRRAILTFKFQRVFCPLRQKLVMLNEINENEYGKYLSKFPDTKFLGRELSDEHAQQISRGEIDPITLQPFLDNDEENRIVDKIVKKKSRKAPIGDSSPKPQNGALPPILRNNPHPEYLELWNLDQRLFWKKYWSDKKKGTLKYGSRRFTAVNKASSQWSNGSPPEGVQNVQAETAQQNFSVRPKGKSNEKLNISADGFKQSTLTCLTTQNEEAQKTLTQSPPPQQIAQTVQSSLDFDEQEFLAEFEKLEKVETPQKQMEQGATMTADHKIYPKPLIGFSSISSPTFKSTYKIGKGSKHKTKKKDKKSDKKEKKEHKKSKKESNLKSDGISTVGKSPSSQMKQSAKCALVCPTESQCDTDNEDLMPPPSNAMNFSVPISPPPNKKSVNKAPTKSSPNEFDMLYQEVMEQQEPKQQIKKTRKRVKRSPQSKETSSIDMNLAEFVQ